MLVGRVLPARSEPLAVAALVTLVAGSCAGWRDQGDTYYGCRGRRARTETTYSFGEPGADWRPVRDKVGRQIQVAWIQPETASLIQVHAQCDEHGDSSLAQYTDHLRIDWTDWNVVEEEEQRLAGRAALRTVVDAQLDGIPRRNEIWVVKKNGCIFDLVYSAPPAEFQTGLGDFRGVVEGFQYPVRP